MDSSLIDKIKYKKERLSFVEKDGKTYIKYKKVRRFRVSKNVKYALLSFFILAILGIGIKLVISELDSREPALETSEGIGR